MDPQERAAGNNPAKAPQESRTEKWKAWALGFAVVALACSAGAALDGNWVLAIGWAIGSVVLAVTFILLLRRSRRTKNKK